MAELINHGNDRVNEIRNMKPSLFNVLLEDITYDDIVFYEQERNIAAGRPVVTGVVRGYSYSDYTCRESTIKNGIANNIRTHSTLRLKLFELAHTFPSREQWERFAVGDKSLGENPRTDEQLAGDFDTTVYNVIEFRTIEGLLKKLREEKGQDYGMPKYSVYKKN